MKFMHDDTRVLDHEAASILEQYEKEDLIDIALETFSAQQTLDFVRDFHGVPGDVSDELLMEHIHNGTMDDLL